MAHATFLAMANSTDWEPARLGAMESNPKDKSGYIVENQKGEQISSLEKPWFHSMASGNPKSSSDSQCPVVYYHDSSLKI